MLLKRRRRTSGSALAEGVMGILMVTCALIAGCVCLADLGMLLYYKTKVAFIADQIAYQESLLPAGFDIQSQAESDADILFRGMHLKITNETVATSVDNGTIKVVVAGDCPLIQGVPDYLPLKIHVSDTSVALGSRPPLMAPSQM